MCLSPPLPQSWPDIVTALRSCNLLIRITSCLIEACVMVWQEDRIFHFIYRICTNIYILFPWLQNFHGDVEKNKALDLPQSSLNHCLRLMHKLISNVQPCRITKAIEEVPCVLSWLFSDVKNIGSYVHINTAGDYSDAKFSWRQGMVLCLLPFSAGFIAIVNLPPHLILTEGFRQARHMTKTGH